MPAERTIMRQVREVLRIPTMTTTRSDGWRPPVPIDDDHGGAEEGAASITMIHRGSAAICSSLAPSLTKIARKITGAHWSGPRFFGLQAKDKTAEDTMAEAEKAPRRTVKRSRCGIYTRKSTEEGLEQDFNSLDAQREACAAFIQSQRHEGWTALPTQYDDGGYSGGTLERPALQRLLNDIEAGRIDVVVVYKVDRLTRALSDFAKLVDVFDRLDVSFVSITQQFNTTTSMGRLTLNILLSFAQFERELIGERVRDKIAASKKKGMWMGGTVPLGYDVRDRKLVVNDGEARTVVDIFRRYLKLKSVRPLAEDLPLPESGVSAGTTPKGVKVTKAEMKRLDIRGDAFHPEWNYSTETKIVAVIVARIPTQCCDKVGKAAFEVAYTTISCRPSARARA